MSALLDGHPMNVGALLLLALTACTAVATPQQRSTPTPEPIVQVIYAIPSDREYESRYDDRNQRRYPSCSGMVRRPAGRANVCR